MNPAQSAESGSRHVVMFSGGLGSWLTAKRVAEKHVRVQTTVITPEEGAQ